MLEHLGSHGDDDQGQDHIWTSFVDLLSGLVAILLLTLLVPNLIKSAREQERLRAATKQKEALNKSGFVDSESLQPLQFDSDEKVLTLGEGAFEKDSYRLTQKIETVLDNCQKHIYTYLSAQTGNQIVIEGHSDALDFRPGSGIRTPVGRIENNYALSALRAVSAREFLVNAFGKAEDGRRKFESKVVVAGYGSDRPRKKGDVTLDPSDPRNRRVEIRFSGTDQTSFEIVSQALQKIINEINKS